MQKKGYFDWLLHDKDVIIPMVIYVGIYGAFSFWLLMFILQLINLLDGRPNYLFLCISGFLLLMSLRFIMKLHRYGGWRCLKGMSINSLVWKNRFKEE